MFAVARLSPTARIRPTALKAVRDEGKTGSRNVGDKPLINNGDRVDSSLGDY